MGEITFDQTKYLQPIGDKVYLLTKARLAAFHQMYPDGTIKNDIVHHEHRFKINRAEVKEEKKVEVIAIPPSEEQKSEKKPAPITGVEDNSYAIIKATIDTGTGMSATGYKLGYAKLDPQHYLKKAATGSMGRALRLLRINTNEVVTRLLKDIPYSTPNELLGEIEKGNKKSPYLFLDDRILLFHQTYDGNFQIETEILDLNMDAPFAKQVKGKWLVYHGEVTFRARLTLPNEDGKGKHIREGVAYGNALGLQGVDWFSATESSSLLRVFGINGLNTLDAEESEFHEDPTDICDGPVVYPGFSQKTDEETVQPLVEVIVVPPVQQPAPAPAPEPEPEPEPKPEPQPQPEVPGLLSNEECKAILQQLRPKFTDSEFVLMCQMREYSNENLRLEYTQWDEFDWNSAVESAQQCLEWKQDPKQDKDQKERFTAFRNVHGAPILEKLSAKLFTNKPTRALNHLEMELLLFKLHQYDYFCGLARAIDHGEPGKDYPILLDTYDLQSPLEFIYNDNPELEKQYIGELYTRQHLISDTFVNQYRSEDLPFFFASYGYGEVPQEVA